MARLRIVFCADASIAVGTGHLRRCIALAHALVKGGADVCFVLHPADGSVAPLMAGLPFECAWLPAEASPTDPEAVIGVAARLRPDIVVVDHYDIAAPWHNAVRAALSCRVAVIDDLADRPLAPDVLIDPNYHPDPAAKYQGIIPDGVRLLAGPRFALLGPTYAKGPRYAFSPDVRSIGIFMGGTDPVDACRAALLGCREVAGFTGPVEVVSSTQSPHFSALQALCERLPGTTLRNGLPDLACFFAGHDLHVGAGGGATWERCCVGAPTIGCLVADNQRATLPYIESLGVLAWANPGGNFSSGSLSHDVGRCVRELLNDPQRRLALAEKGRSLVDGCGALRVATVLDLSVTRAIQLRPATADDEALLLDWANDVSVRANAFQPKPILPAQHAAWFKKRLAQTARCRIFIAQGRSGVPVGQVRFDWRDGETAFPGYWEIGYSLDASFRGLGVASPLLAGAIDALRAVTAPAPVVGRVKPDNELSARTFRALGFEEQDGADQRGNFMMFTLVASKARQ